MDERMSEMDRAIQRAKRDLSKRMDRAHKEGRLKEEIEAIFREGRRALREVSSNGRPRPRKRSRTRRP